MHETSVAQRMVDTAIEVADQNGGGQVVGMRLLLGDMTCVDAETLSFAFGVVSRGTRAEKCQAGDFRLGSPIDGQQRRVAETQKLLEGDRPLAKLLG